MEKADAQTTQTTSHWLRDGLTLLAEATIWACCLYTATMAKGLEAFTWSPLIGLGMPLLAIVAYYIPNAAYSRTARRDEVVACAMKTAFFVCMLCSLGFNDKNLLVILWIFFSIALTVERLLLNSCFIHYYTKSAHHEHAVLICNEENSWQRKALEQSTYGISLTHAPLSTANQLAEFLAENPQTTSIYCVPSSLPSQELETVAHICNEQNLALYLLPLSASTLNTVLQSEYRGTINVLSQDKLSLRSLVNKVIKRLTDILLSLVVLLTIFPIFALLAFICIKRQSRGPILTTRLMCGMNGKPFQCITFRTRHLKATLSPSDNEEEPDMFPFGKFLSLSKLEMLPMFLCVLRGNMTIVGSCMMSPENYTEYSNELKTLFASNYQLKAGMTKYQFPSQENGSTAADVWYFRNWGFWLDLRIMLQRLSALLKNPKGKTITYI